MIKKKDTRDRSEYQRKRREMFPELFRERHRAWRKKNPEKHNANTRKWAKANPEWVREYQKRWREANRDKAIEKGRRHYAKHTEKRREISRKHRRKLMGIGEPPRPMPDLCECCGKKQIRDGMALNVDHCHERRIFRGYLCFRCNTAIGALGDNIAGLERAIAYLRKAEHEAELRLADNKE